MDTKKTTVLFPHILTLIATAMMVVAFFLPISSHTGMDISLWDLMVETDRAGGISTFMGAAGLSDLLIILVVLLGIIGVGSILCAIFALIKKAIPVIVFDSIAFLIFLILTSGIPGGIGYYIYIISSIIAFAGAVWLLVCKTKIKNANKMMTA